MTRIVLRLLPFAFCLLPFLLPCPVFAQAQTNDTAGESRFLTNIRQLTFEGRRSGEGYFSPDGKQLIFQSEREADNPFYQIYILDLESGDSHRVSPGTGKTTCAFFRPGTDEVLFASTHHDAEARAKQKGELDFRASGQSRRYSWDYDDRMDIFSARRDGSQIKPLTTAPGYDAEGSYSPDGKLIAFCSLRDAYPPENLSPEDRKRLQTDPAFFGEIYLMNADGSDPRRLTRSPGYDGGPFFSPDGQRIIWRHFEESGAIADIYTMKLDGSNQRRLTDFKAMSWAPYFHPSGKYVIFAANKLGFSNFELFLVDADGQREPVRVTFTDGFDGLPVFSPDGKKLCWTSGRTSDGKSQLFMADWNDAAALAALGAAPARGKIQSNTSSPSAKQFSADIGTNDLRRQVDFLASDALDGRLTGTPGAEAAAKFIAGYFNGLGLQPLARVTPSPPSDGGEGRGEGARGSIPARPDGTSPPPTPHPDPLPFRRGEGTGSRSVGGPPALPEKPRASADFFQPFDFTAGVRVVTNKNLVAINGERFDSEKDIRPLSFTANGEVEGEVVFVGYGLSVPGKQAEGYDSYAGLDVTNKIVLALRYVPEDVDAKRRAELNRYAGLRYKALIARNRGAKALLVVTGPNSPNAGELAPLTYDSSLAGSGILAASVSGRVAEALMKAAGKDLKTLQAGLDKENPHAEGGFAITNARVKLSCGVEHLKKSDRNVVAVLPPTGGSKEYVMVGAHYDHLGRGETGGFARKDEEGQIHSGADDNASGTAAVLELAAAFTPDMRTEPAESRRGIIFALWSGEELGLIGSTYFAEHPLLPFTNVVAYLNFDMVGRLRENKLTLQGVGSSSAWRKLIEKRNVAAGFNLVLQEDPYLPTDTTAIYPKGVPVLNFFTGSHPEYHRPADKPDTLNYEGLERITKFAHSIIFDLVTKPSRPDYAQVTRSDAGGGSRENLRAYLGTIPDYATEVAGVKLSGARAGGPADKAGVKAGDIIVEFAGQKIANIYDYTYAMDAAKIGQPVKIVVLRDGQRVTLTVTPEARK